MAGIGILTYHNNQNRGGMLQAYCLWKSLSNRFPDKNVEIIDYRTLSKEGERIFTTSVKEAVYNLKDYRTSTRFFKRIDALGGKIITNNHEKAIDFLKEQNYDMLVVGSDVVWRIERRILPFNRPFPNAYYLDPSLKSTKASYAASANKTSLDSLSSEEIDILSHHLSSFDKISVRDRHTKELLEELGISDVKKVPDPTFLVDIPTVQIKSTLQDNGVSLDKPILGLHGPDNEIFRNIAHTFRKRGFQIVSPTVSTLSDIDLFPKLGPLEYYSLYNHFDFVATSSLHSTIFSIKSNTPFVTIDVSSDYKNIESKTYSLLSDMDLLDRHINAVESIPPNIQDTIDECESNLGEELTNERIGALRRQGEEFLTDLPSA